MKTSPISAQRLHASKALIDVDEVSVILAGTPVIHDISFCLHGGEFIGLIGPNGAGKTTLLKTVLGLQKPTTGRINRQPETVIGYIPQRGRQYAASVPMGVLEVVMLGTADGSAKSALESLAGVQLEHLARQPFTTLSGGQQQRVAIAKALAGNAGLLILDEPTTGIDDQSQQAFYTLLRDLHARGITIVMVSHEVEAVLNLVTRVICLNQTIIYDGPPEHFEADTYTPRGHTKQHIQLHHTHGGTHA